MSDNTNDKNINSDAEEAVDETTIDNSDDLEQEISQTEDCENLQNEAELADDEEIYEEDLDSDNEIAKSYDKEADYSDDGADSQVLSKIIRKIRSVIYDIKYAETKRKNKILRRIAVFSLLAVLILTDLIPILPNAYNRFYVGNTYTIGETQGGVYDKIGKNILYAGNGTLMSFEPDMSCVFNIETHIGNSRVETKGSNAIVHYQNSNEATLITDTDKIKTVKADDIIKGAAITQSGYYGFVYDEPGYKACVNVFSPNNTSIYKWHTNNPILDIAISEDGKYMVASSYTIDETAIGGKLIFFDLEKSTPVKELAVGTNVVSELSYVNGDVAVAFGDLYTSAYTKNGVMKWRVDYSGRNLKSYDINTNGDFAFIFDRYSSELSESVVEIYNTNGKLKGNFESEDNVKYVSANNGCYLLSLDRQTILLDDDADVMKRKHTDKDYRRAVLYYNYNFAFSISDSVASIMSVNH